MAIEGIIKKGEYFDSVSLMIVAKKINERKGIIDSAVVMGTAENKAILQRSNFLLKKFETAVDTDLLIAINGETKEIALNVIETIDQELKNMRGKALDNSKGFSPKSFESALEMLEGANLSLISVSGKYAASEAMKALKRGLHVMLFSDNVPIEEEIKLKEYAVKNNLLVMGPDCGTAIINGVPLAFANVVKRGNIGIVAASGTGLQEVTTLISNMGGGISQAIGTGGRDVKKEVGGLMFISAINALMEDQDTKAILLVSKPPHQSVLEKIGNIIKGSKKPIAATFLGADPQLVKSYGMNAAATLEEGAEIILKLTGAEVIKQQPMDIDSIAKEQSKKISKERKYLRALFTGGTFCSETQIILSGMENLYSNAPTSNSKKMENSWKSQQHTVVDLGEDEFTVGKPHPMIDFGTRNSRIIEEAKDPQTAVILLDMVLGYGANLNPLPEIIPILKQVKEIANDIPLICSVTGTNDDPQNRQQVVEAFEKCGVIVCQSNAQASKLSKKIIESLEK